MGGKADICNSSNNKIITYGKERKKKKRRPGMLFNMHSVQERPPPSPSPKDNLAKSAMPRIRNPVLERN